MGGRSIILLKFASLYAAGVRVTSSGNFNVFNTEARSRRLLLAEGETFAESEILKARLNSHHKA